MEASLFCQMLETIFNFDVKLSFVDRECNLLYLEKILSKISKQLKIVYHEAFFQNSLEI